MAKIKYPKSHEINWNNSEVWKHIVDSPVGIFQFEGSYAFDLLKKYGPDEINSLSLVNASLRPSGESYRDRLIAREVNHNPSEIIDKLLESNGGFLVFQEDTIKFLTEICGLSGSEADNVRRAIGRKQLTRLQEALPQILEGYCSKSDKPREVAEEEANQFLQIISDSSNYQFGYNHSTGYSMIGYTCAYLRYYYPKEFIAAYLNNANNDSDIVSGTILANQLGIAIKSIKFRHSKVGYFCDNKENVIYKGIGSVKFMNDQIADELYELRDNQYPTFIDLLYDIKSKTTLNSRQLDILIKIDFFEEFGDINKLLYIHDKFKTLYDKTQIRKDKLKELDIPEEIVRKYSGKEVLTIVKEIDYTAYLKSLGIINIEEELQDCIKYKYEKKYTTEQQEELEELEGLQLIDIDDSPFVDDIWTQIKARIEEIESQAEKVKIPNGYNFTKIFKKYELTDEELQQFATKISYGRFEDINVKAILCTLLDTCDIEPITISQRIKYQIEHLGYVEYQDPEADKRLIAILDLDTTYTPKFEAYNLRTGQTCTMKIRKKIPRNNKKVKTSFSEIPIENGDVIYMTHCSKEPKKKKAADGSWIDVEGEYYWFIDEYRKIAY